MKKVFILFIFLLIPKYAFAFQDYLIFSEFPVKSVVIKDGKYAEILPLQTIDNTKQTIIFRSLKEGKTSFVIKNFNDEAVTINADIKSDTTDFSKQRGIEYFPCDFPPEGLIIDGNEIPNPPQSMGGI